MLCCNTMTSTAKTKAATAKEVEKFLKRHSHWKLKNSKLFCQFKFKNFKDAFCFMTQVAFESESANHHPEWSNVYNMVTIELITHDSGPATSAKDFALAAKIDLFYLQYK